MTSLIKTSYTHPIRIDTVRADSAPGYIGMTFCPGKKLANAYSGGDWDRDLDKDLDAIVEAGASMLITLIEGHEFEEMKVTSLPQKAEAHGLKWVHLPIRDKGIPDAAFEDAWDKVGDDLHQHLLEGETIVIHCKGGLGRTGVIAARLLIGLGEEATTSIEKVRSARPGTIETQAQEAYVLHLKCLE